MSKPKELTAEQKASAQKKEEILSTYVDLIDSGTYFPSLLQMRAKGFTREMIRHSFGTLAGLRKAAKEAYPEAFAGSIDVNDYVSPKYLNDLRKEIKKHKRFIITTAVSGQELMGPFMESMRNYADVKKAKLLILPSHDPAHNLDNEIEWHFDDVLLTEHFVFEDTNMNSNLFICGIRVTAKQINPITGLNEVSQLHGSLISASPKQFLEYDSVSANKLPHARMTTGACTLPNYKTSLGNSLRTGYLADVQHVVGAIIVEIVDNNIYHFRQIQAGADGSFCDLGFKYSPTKVTKEIPVLVMGDYHAGEHDESAVGAWTEAINSMGIEEVVFHDMFNGASINHHEENDIMLRAERIRKGLNSLETELTITAKEFDRILSLKSVKSAIVVKSNHDDFIDRWVRPYKFAKEPINAEFGTILAADLILASKKGIKKDFFKTALELNGPPKHINKIRWLHVDEDYVVGGVHLGAHGDKAANGARGSIKSLAKSYPRCVIGHSHTPGIFKGAFQVGTTGLLRQGFNKGPSSWVHCSCLVYKNGQRQLINSINGAWKLNE